jgi:hypothetical protein
MILVFNTRPLNIKAASVGGLVIFVFIILGCSGATFVPAIDRFLIYVILQHIQIVAEIQLVHRRRPQRQDRCAW